MPYRTLVPTNKQNTHNMKTLRELESIAMSAGFEFYSDFLHPDKIEYPNVSELIMTCSKGRYMGEVVEIRYNCLSGEVISTNVYSQFKGGTKFSFA